MENSQGAASDGSEPGKQAECFDQLRLLAQFATSRSEEDVRRIIHFSRKYRALLGQTPQSSSEDTIYPAYRLSRTLSRILSSHNLGDRPAEDISSLVLFLTALASRSARLLARYSFDYFAAVNSIWHHWQDVEKMQDLVLAILSNHSVDAYVGFSWIYLRQEEIPGFHHDIAGLSHRIDLRRLDDSVSDTLSGYTNLQLLEANDKDGLLWLLARLIYFHKATGRNDASLHANYVRLISRLITALADDIGKRIDGFDAHATSLASAANGSTSTRIVTLPNFVREQILSLVSQENVAGLLSSLEGRQNSSAAKAQFSTEASDLASYVLTLLRVFPRRRNDIQLWLYRGSVKNPSMTERSLPAAKYLYHAASKTSLFAEVIKEPRSVLAFFSFKESSTLGKDQKGPPAGGQDEQWRVILLFLELYSFILQVMDDEEFHSGVEHADDSLSWTRRSALPLVHVRDLSSFLRNLAFALYWYPSQISSERQERKPQSLAAYFGRADNAMEVDDEDDMGNIEEREIAGVSGMTLSSLKGLVVGVLRMIYQRE